jgi:hypothetical protein
MLQVTLTDSHAQPKSDSVDVYVIVYDLNDITSPHTPTTAKLLGSSDSGVFKDDNITTHKQLSFELMCSEVGSTLELLAGPLALKPVLCKQAGQQTMVVNQELSEGTHHVSYVETDAAGNQSAPSMALLVTIDRQAPSLSIHEHRGDVAFMAGHTDPFSLVEMATSSDTSCITSSNLFGEFSCQFKFTPFLIARMNTMFTPMTWRAIRSVYLEY